MIRRVTVEGSGSYQSVFKQLNTTGGFSHHLSTEIHAKHAVLVQVIGYTSIVVDCCVCLCRVGWKDRDEELASVEDRDEG